MNRSIYRRIYRGYKGYRSFHLVCDHCWQHFDMDNHTHDTCSSDDMFILGLSAAGILVSRANMLLTVVSIFTREWPLSDSACVVFGYINMLTLVTSVMALCNISINRYFMVCRPSKFQDIYTRRNAIFMIPDEKILIM